MSKRPQIRAVASTVFVIEPEDVSIPKVVLSAGPGIIKMTIEGITSMDHGTEDVSIDTMPNVVADELIKLANNIRQLKNS